MADDTAPPVGATLHLPTDRIRRFVADNEPPTPCLVVDLAIVAERYQALSDSLTEAAIFYAVKANPAPEILRLLVELGSCFDVASVGEIEACLRVGAPPSTISYGNTIKKRKDIAYAHEMGVRMFAFDSAQELDKLSAEAPGSTVFCRILTAGEGADWPLSRKFGCEPLMAVDLLRDAAQRGHRVGASFHVGSQQRQPNQWDGALAEVAAMFRMLERDGVIPAVVNLGGGFPSRYSDAVPDIGAYAKAIRNSVARHLGPMMNGPDRPLLIAEPGRYLVGDAGVLFSEVVLVSRKSDVDERRWVYLDVGMFSGLAETMDEAIRYRIRTPHDGTESGPVVVAGPTCDSVDILYDKSNYHMPLALRPGDIVEILSTGAYTTTYSTVGFNGFPPLRSYCV